MAREAAVVNACTRLLKKRGAWHMNVHGAGTGRNGLPDLIACHHGRFIAIECKAPRGRIRPLQQHELDRITSAGGHAIVARTTTQLADILDAIDQEHQ